MLEDCTLDMGFKASSTKFIDGIKKISVLKPIF